MHWIDHDSESDNVIGITDSMIYIGSCDSEACTKVDQELAKQISPVEVLGTEDVMTIPFIHIQKLISRSTDKDIDVSYKAKKDIEEKSLFFSEVDDKQQFLAAIDQFMPERLTKNESKQSAAVAAISPFVSLVLSLVTIYFFMDKLRVPAFVIGGLWAVASIYMLLSRIKNPPTVTRYALGGRYLRKFWNGAKTCVAYGIVVVVMLAVHQEFPTSYGPSAIYEHAQNEKLLAADVPKFLDRGADIDHQGENGSTSLSIAMDWGQDELAIALIESGANLVNPADGYGTPIEYAMYSDSSVEIIESMLKNGASLDFELDGMTPLAYSREYENQQLEEVIVSYANAR